jgi:2-oxoglutarate dehydrogenase E2 component (dihydrolipoamide succinyltransferase)
MPIDVVLPALGLTMSEGTIVRWLKRPGEPVAKDEPLLVVETDKAEMEVLSPAPGRSARSWPRRAWSCRSSG